MLRRIVIGIALLAAVLAGGLALVPVLVPAETVRAQVAAQIESRTGWRVAFDGPVTLAVFPEIALSAERLRVESAPDARDALAADVERAAFGLALVPLLSGEVRLTVIALERPVVRVVRGVGPAPAAEGDAAAGETGRGPLSGVSVDRLVVTDGLIVLRGASGETRLDDLALTLSMPDPAREATIEAQGRLDGRALAVSARLDAPAALLAGAEAGFALTLTAPDRLAAPLSAEGRVALAPARLVLRGLALASGESRLSGDLDLSVSGPTPAVDARLAGPLLDLDALAPGGGGGGSDALDLSALGAVVGDVEVALDRLRIAGREIAPVTLQAQLEGDAAQLVVDEAGFAAGSVSGEARIGRDGARARVSGALAARNLDVAALAPPGAVDVSGRIAADLRFALAGETPAALVSSLNLAGRVALSEGAARLPSLAALATDGDPERLGALALTLDIADVTQPVAATGEAVWRGDRVVLSGTAALRALLSGEPASVAVELASERVTLGYRGTLAPGGALAGSASLSTGSLRGLLAWLGRPAAAPGGLGAFSVSGRLDLSPGAVAFTDARIALDGASGAGSVRIAAGPRPRVNASLDIERLDLNPYFGLSAERAGAAAGEGWSETPIDLSALRGVDADLDLRVGALRFRTIDTGRVVAAARLEGGRLEADLQEITLYGGGGNGRIVVDAAPAAPTLAARLTFADLDALGFLDAAAGIRRIEGRGGVSLDVSGRLVTQRTLMETLSGTVGFAFRDGAIRGLDVTALGGLLATGIVDGWRLADGARTELFAFDATFAVAQGQATTQNLRMVGPSIDLTGEGVVDLPAQRLSLRLDPRIALERRRGEGIELVGFGAPIRVEGPWTRPRLYPDVAGILQDPVGAYERLRSLGSGVFGIEAPAAGEALERVLGGEAARGIETLLGVAQPPAPPPPAPQETLPQETFPQEAPPAAPAFDPAVEAARGLIELLNRNR